MGGSVWVTDGSELRQVGKGAANEPNSRKIPAVGDVVIAGSGGLPPALSGSRLLLVNEGAKAFASALEPEIRRRMKRAGAGVAEHSAEDSGTVTKRLRVSLFQLQPIAVELLLVRRGALPHGSGTSGIGQLKEEDGRYRSVTRLAARALYAAGLDCGIVELTADERGRFAVAGVSLPPLRQLSEGSGVWGEAARRLAAELDAAGQPESGGDILLGADPEFLLLTDSGKVVSAARYLEGGHGAGCDGVVIGGRVQYPIAELRPAPAGSPAALARNIQKLLQLASQRIPDQPPLRWTAGGMPAAGFALGGHLHLSGVPFSGRLLRLLDSCLAFPLAMIESPAEQARRPRYGYLGDFRLQPHGGFEYRTLPSWLASPLAAKAAFAMALLCAREWLSLTSCPAADERFVDAYYSGDRDELRGCADDLVAAMAGTESYAELGGWIEPLFEAIRERRTWDPAADFRAKWRIGTKG
ncbi:putative amidoligase domain-containing protein [Paenibacillus silvisoli]|uniref:putative amidoligase domain-containing protein n=1 Tax=Paenibacillus silvisoli TaxID=3110539 RepID=UPI00280446AA|nr:hypothetical protein [Paenibacillus silvisoli]